MRTLRRTPVLALLLIGVASLFAPGAAAAAGWTIQSTPNPTGSPSLGDVSCTGADACTAVGSSSNGSLTATLAERWTGTKWTIQKTPNPTGSTVASLGGVSCTAANACTAVGSYQNSSENLLALSERWNGKKWTIQATPNPKGTTGASLNSVSCTAAQACTAVGYYNNNSGNEVTLAERWNGKKWTIQPTPNPTGSTDSVLDGVACVKTACTAVGSDHKSGEALTLAERWNGKKWAIKSTRNPTGTGGPGDTLHQVSCTATNACTAVGRNYSTENPRTLAERWNGKSWSLQTAPTKSGISGLTGVSCTAAQACTAVGTYSTNPNTGVTLAEHWNGTKWAIQSTPSPGYSAGLSGDSCTASNTCTAVGDYYPTPDAGQKTLAERHT